MRCNCKTWGSKPGLCHSICRRISSFYITHIISRQSYCFKANLILSIIVVVHRQVPYTPSACHKRKASCKSFCSIFRICIKTCCSSIRITCIIKSKAYIRESCIISLIPFIRIVITVSHTKICRSAYKCKTYFSVIWIYLHNRFTQFSAHRNCSITVKFPDVKVYIISKQMIALLYRLAVVSIYVLFAVRT